MLSYGFLTSPSISFSSIILYHPLLPLFILSLPSLPISLSFALPSPSLSFHTFSPLYLLRHLEWRHLEATVNADTTVDVKDVTNDAKEHLEFQDRIIKASLGWGHLIVTTSTQCYIFK